MRDVGDIIYPQYNGTAAFWKQSRWDLVMKVDKDGKAIHVRHLWSWSAVQAIKAMQDLYKLTLIEHNDDGEK